MNLVTTMSRPKFLPDNFTRCEPSQATQPVVNSKRPAYFRAGA
jgi:hypothetical protein